MSAPTLSDLDSRVAALAAEVAQIETENVRELITFGHLLAGMYALRRAINFETAEVTDPFPDNPDTALRIVASSLAKGEMPHESWLVGFYLAVAEERLSAAEARLKRYYNISLLNGQPKPKRVQFGTARKRPEEIAAAVEHLEEISRAILPA